MQQDNNFQISGTDDSPVTVGDVPDVDDVADVIPIAVIADEITEVVPVVEDVADNLPVAVEDVPDQDLFITTPFMGWINNAIYKGATRVVDTLWT